MSGASEPLGLRVRDGWPPTGGLAVVGSTIFVSGFFLLAVAGRGFDIAVQLLVLSGAAVVLVPILALGVVVAWSEALLGRAWASGFRPLTRAERRGRGTAERAMRYAGFLWLANGCALWFATLAAQV